MPKKCMELLQKGAEIRKVNAFWALYLPKERKFGVNWALQNDFFLYAQISSCTAIQVKSLRLNQFLIFRFTLGEQTDHNIDGHFLLVCSNAAQKWIYIPGRPLKSVYDGNIYPLLGGFLKRNYAVYAILCVYPGIVAKKG